MTPFNRRKRLVHGRYITRLHKFTLDSLAAGAFALAAFGSVAGVVQAAAPTELASPLVPNSQVIYEKTIKVEEATKQEDTSSTPTVDQIVDGIWALESSRGQAKVGLQAICEKQGKSNEFGYGGMKLKICFSSHQEAKAKVSEWVGRHLAKFDGNVNKTLCWYNLGLEKNSCKYSEDFKKVSK